MSDWSPPAVRRSWIVLLAALAVLVLAYALLVVQQILLGVVIVLQLTLLVVVLYLAWRFVVAVEAIADAQQRRAVDREGE